MSQGQVANRRRSDVHPVDEVLPPGRLALLGLQHLFIMYAGAVAVPLIVGGALGLEKETIALLVSADLLVSGIATVIQAVGIGKIFGVRLPVVAGATFTALSPMIIIAQSLGASSADACKAQVAALGTAADQVAAAVKACTSGHGMQYVYGAVLISGVFGLIVAKPFSKMIRFFPPLVAGTTIAVIGLSLIGADLSLIVGPAPQDVQDFANAHFGDKAVSVMTGVPIDRMALAALVVLLIIVITRIFRGFVGQIAVLISIVIGTLAAWPMGLLNFSPVAEETRVVAFSGFLHFGAPKFEISAIISFCIVMLVTFTESTADMIAVGEMVDKEVGPNDLARGLATDAVSAVLAGFMNSFPDTAFAENVGLVGLTKVRSRWVVATCGVFLIILGFIPKVGAIVVSVPDPVIGGAATVMFAMVTAVGIQTMHKVSFKDNHNLLIVAVALSFGLLPAIDTSLYSQFPSWFQVIFGSSITTTVIIVFVLNLVFNHWTTGTRPAEDAVQTAVDEGAVVLDIPHGGVPERLHDVVPE